MDNARSFLLGVITALALVSVLLLIVLYPKVEKIENKLASIESYLKESEIVIK